MLLTRTCGGARAAVTEQCGFTSFTLLMASTCQSPAGLLDAHRAGRETVLLGNRASACPRRGPAAWMLVQNTAWEAGAQPSGAKGTRAYWPVARI